VHLLPYHRFGESKYAKLGRAFDCVGSTPERETVEEIKAELESHRLRVMVGG
jgi:pyruvate formate lyase activating enzyme